jgi:hypothetical protein
VTSALSEMDFGAALFAKLISAPPSGIKYRSIGAMLVFSDCACTGQTQQGGRRENR